MVGRFSLWKSLDPWRFLRWQVGNWHSHMAGSSLAIEFKEMTDDLIPSERIRQSIGREDRLVEDTVGIFEPSAFAGSAKVVELGESTALEVGFGDGRFAGGGFWVEPVVTQAEEFASGVGDGFDARVFAFGGFGSGRPRKGEGQKA
jgi:hypothetical protein